MQATYDDANLILKLFELRRDETLRKARAWFGPNFNPTSPEDMWQKFPPGSQESAYVRMVISYWDMAASFVAAGVLNQELFFQTSGEMLVVWEKIRPLLDGIRQMTKNPKVWANLETVGNAYIKYMESQGPEAYAAFQGMLKMMSANPTGQAQSA
jgi:hypothetical protein